MAEIKSYTYNPDTDTIYIVKPDEAKIHILCAAVEDSLNTTTTTRSKLVCSKIMSHPPMRNLCWTAKCSNSWMTLTKTTIKLKATSNSS